MKKEKKALQPIDQPVFGYWQALYRSFYSGRLYVDVAKRWRGYGFLYLLLMVSILSIPLILKLMVYFNDYYDRQLVEPISKIPTLYIQNGEISLDKPMPYLIKGDQGQVLVVIDTTGRITKMTDKYPDMTILMTKNKIFMRSPASPLTYALGDKKTDDQVDVQELGKNMNQVFNGAAWVKSSNLNTIKYISLLMSPIMILSFFYSMLLIFMPLIGFLGQQFAMVFFSFKIKFKPACRLVIVAATPGMLYLQVSLTTGYTYPGYGLVSMIILFIYFGYGLSFVKNEKQQVARR